MKNAPADFMEKKPLYKPYKSNKSNKKGMVYVIKNQKKSLIHFGDASMQDFTQHRDPARRKAYCARSGGITDKNGRLTATDKNSANYWSRKILWNC